MDGGVDIDDVTVDVSLVKEAPLFWKALAFPFKYIALWAMPPNYRRFPYLVIKLGQGGGGLVPNLSLILIV